MKIIIDILRSDVFLIGVLFCIIILFILYISSIIKLNKLRKSYTIFMKKLGNGEQIDEILKAYINKVEEVEGKNEEIIKYCNKLDMEIEGCIQKIGIVRYNAFKDTGSDLSFSLALLNEHNSGVVLNGIYARDTSNIYAKPIEKGVSKYVLSEEEKEALNRAMNS